MEYQQSSNLTGCATVLNQAYIQDSERYPPPPPLEFIPYSISIESQNGCGYILRIGCKTFCLTDVETVLDSIEVYLKNPQEAQNEFLSKEPKSLKDIQSFLKSKL